MFCRVFDPESRMGSACRLLPDDRSGLAIVILRKSHGRNESLDHFVFQFWTIIQTDVRDHNAFFSDGVHVLPVDRQHRMHDEQLVFTAVPWDGDGPGQNRGWRSRRGNKAEIEFLDFQIRRILWT